MKAFSRILFDMKTGDADLAGFTIGQIENNRSLADNGLGELGNLIEGSIILFVSTVNKRMVLDTCFVVGEFVNVSA